MSLLFWLWLVQAAWSERATQDKGPQRFLSRDYLVKKHVLVTGFRDLGEKERIES